MTKIKHLFSIVFLAGALYLLFEGGIRFIYIDSSSILPTIKPGDRLAVVGTGRGLPERGSVINFRLRKNGIVYYVKRVAGLPGDIIEVRDGGLYLNGEPEEEPYLNERDILYTLEPFEVPEGHLFVLGDNRNFSYDSSEWGFLPVDDVIGKVVFVYWPYLRLME